MGACMGNLRGFGFVWAQRIRGGLSMSLRLTQVRVGVTAHAGAVPPGAEGRGVVVGAMSLGPKIRIW
jgi:hypothetical protein